MKNNFLNLDEYNNAVISMTVYDKDVFLSPLSYDKPIISSEVNEFLENSMKNVSSSVGVTLHIKGNTSDEEKKLFKDAISNYYTNEFIEDIRELVRNRWISFSLYLIGIIIIAILIFLKINNLGELWSTVLEIVGWVFIWQATDKLFFEGNRIKRRIRMQKRLIGAKIVFE